MFATAQTKREKTIQKLFAQAQEQVEDSLYNEALLTYKQIRKIADDNSTAFAKATYNMGYTNMLLNDEVSAREIFLLTWD